MAALPKSAISNRRAWHDRQKGHKFLCELMEHYSTLPRDAHGMVSIGSLVDLLVGVGFGGAPESDATWDDQRILTEMKRVMVEKQMADSTHSLTLLEFLAVVCASDQLAYQERVTVRV